MDKITCKECSGKGKVMHQGKLEEDICEKCNDQGFYYDSTVASTCLGQEILYDVLLMPK